MWLPRKFGETRTGDIRVRTNGVAAFSGYIRPPCDVMAKYKSHWSVSLSAHLDARWEFFYTFTRTDKSERGSIERLNHTDELADISVTSQVKKSNCPGYLVLRTVPS